VQSLAFGFAMLLQAAAAGTSTIESVTLQRSGPAEDIVIVLSSPETAATVRGEGTSVIVEVAASMAPAVRLPEPGMFVLGVDASSPASDVTTLSLAVGQGITYEVERDDRLLRVVFRRSTSKAQVSELYAMLFPGSTGTGAGEAPAVRDVDDEPDGFVLGRTAVRPAADVVYTSGRTSFARGPVPERDAFVETRPRIDTDTRLGLADLRLSYELRWRRGSEFEESNMASHILDAGMTAPLGSRLVTTAHHHHFEGRQEANEADPGGELFYSRERFTKDLTTAGLTVEVGPLTRLVATGHHRRHGLDSEVQFFSHTKYGAGLSARRELGPNLIADLGYGFERVPAPEARPLVASRTESGSFGLRGDLSARLLVDGSVAYERRTTPAVPEGTASDLAVSAKVLFQSTPSSTLELTVGRARNVSAFEQNPYYRSQHARLKVSLMLPLSLAGEMAARWQSNTYPLVAQAIGDERHDRVLSWSASLIKPIRRAHARLDYVWSRRTSNVPDLSFRSHSLMVTVGIRPYPTRADDTR
jgi:hypothetical protein